MRPFNDGYDFFEVGETWYTVRYEEVCVKYELGEVPMAFNSQSEIIILKIEKESGYGKAYITINGYSTELGLDELYDMTMMEE